jgi:hypothetical protein
MELTTTAQGMGLSANPKQRTLHLVDLENLLGDPQG